MGDRFCCSIRRSEPIGPRRPAIRGAETRFLMHALVACGSLTLPQKSGHGAHRRLSFRSPARSGTTNLRRTGNRLMSK